MKKKFKNSTISREDLDDAIANGIKLALKEQQSTLNSGVASAVRDAVDSMLIPGFYQLPVSAEEVCRGSTGRQRENSGHYLSGPAGGA